MADTKLAAYVDAACALQGLTLTIAERERVLLQFDRLATIAAPLLAAPLPVEDEPATVFKP